MERTIFNKAQLEMLDIMAGIRTEEELNARGGHCQGGL